MTISAPTNAPRDPRAPSARLADTELFAGVDASTLARFDADASRVRLRGGEVLFAQSDPADAMYFVLQGRLEIWVRGRGGRERLVNVVGAGASIGEMGVLTDDRRSATVRAIRDSELVRISNEEFSRLIEDQPRIGLALSRLLTRRLRDTTSAPRLVRYARTVALVPATRAGLPRSFAARLAAALEALASGVVRVDSATVDAELGVGTAESSLDETGDSRLVRWLDEREEQARFVLYECDAEPTPWTRRCVRQSDIVLVVADARGDPSPGEIERVLGATEVGARARRRELVLVHPDDAGRPRNTATWLDARAADGRTVHHHVRLGDARDCARLARAIGEVSLGLALSGGGARGFAEIGVIRALAEQGLDVDVVGGTSMGAVIGGLLALGEEWPTIVELCRREFVGFETVRDLTFPSISLMRGESTVKLLRALFGDVQIEDLWIPYFCVSANLSRAVSVVHDRGPLWLWTRASSAIPGIAPPVPYKGELLVDGGVLNNLPADLVRGRCRGSVIAVDVGAAVDLRTEPAVDAPTMSGWRPLARALNPFARQAPFPNILRILSRTATLGSVRDQEAMRDVADLYLHPPTDGVDPLDWKGIDGVVEIGYRDAYDRIAAWAASSMHTAAYEVAHRTGSWEVR